MSIRESFYKGCFDNEKKKKGTIDNKYLKTVINKYCKVMRKEEYLKMIVKKHTVSLDDNIIIFFSSEKAFHECLELYSKHYILRSVCGKYMADFPKENFSYNVIRNRYETSRRILLPILRIKDFEGYHPFTREKIQNERCYVDTTNDIALDMWLDGKHNVFIWEEGLTQEIYDLKEILEAEREEVLSRKISDIENVCEAYGITPEQFEELREKVYNIKHQYEAEGIRYEEGV